MLLRSTSFDTRPIPMKTAMNRPNQRHRARPRSLMILTSCPAVSWPSSMRRRDQQDGEEHQVVEHLVAHRLAEDVHGDPARSFASRDPRLSLGGLLPTKIVLERLAQPG